MQIVLYKSHSEKNALTKTWSTTSGDIKTYNTAYAVDQVDLLAPDITLADTGLEAFNYMHIPELNRWYYIKPVITATGYYRLNAHCDVLMSHAAAIRAQSGILARSETVFNTYLSDRVFNALVYRRTQTIPFPGHPFTTSSGGYFLATTGGYTPPAE